MIGRRSAIRLALAVGLVAGIVALAQAVARRSGGDVVLPAYLSQFGGSSARPDYDALSAVLAKTGEHPFRSLPTAATRDALGRFLAELEWIGPRTRPELFPDSKSRVAYFVNAHVAWTLALHDLGGLAPENLTQVSAARFRLDGSFWTLTTIEDEIAAVAADEPRMALFLNPGFANGPPLPRAALEDYALDFQISDQARRCGRIPGFWSLEDAHRLGVSAFAERFFDLPDEPRARTRQLLHLVPPPDALRQRIDASCGPSLERCTIFLIPLHA